jgi:hypothetical protein
VKYPTPPVVIVNRITGQVDIDFDKDFDFTPEAAERVRRTILDTFPARHILTDRVIANMEALAYQLQEEAFQRGELIPKDPLGIIAAQHKKIEEHLRSLPDSECNDRSVPSTRSIRKTLDEAIADTLKIARYGEDDVETICWNHQLNRWLTELKERRTLGYHPPCPSCMWNGDRCTVTARGEVSKDWHCTMYEHKED